MSRGWPLVGRDGELKTVGRRLRSPGGPRGVGLFGEAGVGKTRLLTEVVDGWRGEGGRVELIAATDAASEIPLGSFAHLLDPTDKAHRPDELLHLALARLWEKAATEEPTPGFLLAVDDAHLLDNVSVTVLHLAVTQLGMPAIMTVRTGEPVPDGLARLWKDELVERYDLTPLARDTTERLVVTALGDTVPASLLDRIAALSEGNPLLIRELVLAVSPLPVGPSSRPDRLALPHQSGRIRDLVEERLRSLDRRSRTALELIALGEQLPFSTLDRLIDPTTSAVLEDIGLVQLSLPRSASSDGTGGERWLEVAHPLYREVIVASLPVARRQALLRRLAETLETAPGIDPLRLARWRLECGVLAPAGATIDLAREALGRFDHPLAERLAREVATSGGPEQAEAGLVLGEALAGQARLAEADGVLAALQPRSPAQHADVAIARASHLFLRLNQSGEALDVLRAAADALETHPDRQSECRSVLAQFLWFALRLDEGGQLAEDLLAAPELPATAQIRATSVAVTTRCAQGRLDDGLALLTEHVFDLAYRHRRDVPYGDIQLRMARYLALYWAGRLPELDAYSAAGLGIDLDYPPPSLRGILAGFRGGALLLQGRAHAALEELSRASRALAEADWFGQRPLAEAMRARAAVFAGDLAQADDAFAAAEAAFAADPLAGARTLPYIELTRAWRQAATGSIGAATERCAQLAEQLAGVAKPLAVEAYHAAARLGGAGQVADDLTSLAAQVDGPGAVLAAAHVEALAAANGDLLGQVSEDFEALGAILLAAEASRSAANAYQEAGRGASTAAAANRTVELLDRCGPVRSPALEPLPPMGDPLTPREREVALLAAAGRTSAEIAAELYVSVRTVDTHLYRTYRKLMIEGRDDLSRAFAAGST